MRSLRVIEAVFFASFCLASPLSQGAEILLTASGTISAVSDGLAPGFSVGDRVTYQLLYDPASASSHSRPSFGLYLDAISSFTVSAGNFRATAPAGEIRIAADVAEAGDVLIVESSFPDGLTGTPVAGLPPTRIAFQLWDTQAQAWDGPELPGAFPPISTFDNSVFTIDFIDSRTTYIVTGLLDSLTVSTLSSPADQE